MLDAELRRLSKEALGRTHLLEIALAVLGRKDDTFVFDDLFSELAAAADEAGLEAPSPSGVRSDLERLRLLRAIDRLPRVRGELIRHEVRRSEAVFWELVRELIPDAETRLEQSGPPSPRK